LQFRSRSVLHHIDLLVADYAEEVTMRALPLSTGPALWSVLTVLVLLNGPASVQAQEDRPDLATKARALFQTHCYRCHGQDGANEGGLNFILDRDKLVATLRQKLTLAPA